MSERKRTVISVLIFLAIFLCGTFGYMVIEGWNFTDAFYMTVITLTTVGFGEVHEIGTAGRVFTAVLILSGVGIIVYIISMLSQFVVEGRLREILGRQKLEKRIHKLRNHYIVCGYGRVGQIISDIFSTEPFEVVVIERNPDKAAHLHDKGVLHVTGEATDEETLIAAGIEHAKSLVTALGSDMDNVYVTLSARALNPKLFIMARSGSVGSGRKLLRAGADKVVSPYRIGARRMAHMILRPAVTDFLDVAMMDKDIDIQMEEMPVKASSHLTGIPLKDSGIRQDLNLIIIAVKKDNGDMLLNPSSKATLDAGDIVIVVGERNNLAKLENLLNPVH